MASAGEIVDVIQAENPESVPLLKFRSLIGRPIDSKACWNHVKAGSTQLHHETCSGPPVALKAAASYLTVALGVCRLASLGGVRLQDFWKYGSRFGKV